ncbi:hypothetical protein [Dactylosporangium sp. NPDC050588]|uniref:hypothetical protein n=1 Tax=Dactylosporangium sp. NPDC050588 TaxID=3157211 RepID=UPI00340E2A97
MISGLDAAVVVRQMAVELSMAGTLRGGDGTLYHRCSGGLAGPWRPAPPLVGGGRRRLAVLLERRSADSRLL